MDEKINVTVCTGTTCYVMGGAVLYGLEKTLKSVFGEKVEFSGSTCLGFCKDSNNGKPPFASVNGKVIASATAEKIIAEAERMLNEGVKQS